MNEKEITIRVLPDFGSAYYVTIIVDGNFDIEGQVDAWVNDNLINVQDWEWE